MLDVVVGIFVFLFVVLGLREGIFKSLGSVAAVFVALFFATSALTFVARGDPRLADPNYLGATVLFLLVWALSYIVLDILLTLLFKKIITIIILGPVDKAGGLLIGGFKGLLICGIILQLVLALPISTTSRKTIKESIISRYAIAAYHWAYPYAKKFAPAVNNFMKQNLIDRVGKQEKPDKSTEELNEVGPGQILGKGIEYEKIKKEQEEKIRKLLKEQKLLHGAPLNKTEEIK